MNFNLTWQFFAVGSAFFAGLTVLFGKIGVSEVNSNLATLIRTVVIFFITLVIVELNHEWQKPQDIPHKSLVFLILSGFATGFSWLCYYRALQLGPASLVAPVDKLSVVFAILLAVVFLGEHLTLKASLGGLLIISGSILMIWA